MADVWQRSSFQQWQTSQVRDADPEERKGDGMIRRWMFTVASAFSLLLSMATAGRWLRSYQTSDKFTFDSTQWIPNRHAGPYPHVFLWHDKSLIVFVSDGYSFFKRDDRDRGIFSRSGQAVDDATHDHPLGRHFSHEQFSPQTDDDFLFGDLSSPPRYLGFVYPHYVSLDWMPMPLYAISLRFLVEVMGVLPVLWLFTWLHRRAILARLVAKLRSRVGYCRRCGYDLRASTEQCPECGTPI
jgi:hypothetical protein